mmetsp:Transcript_49862/g.93292  ORF Transcript_49862/g.93292 Transcript_49862/m.93292 type:complete len:302 (-) Transcript_49862:128-1033(-)
MNMLQRSCCGQASNLRALPQQTKSCKTNHGPKTKKCQRLPLQTRSLLCRATCPIGLSVFCKFHGYRTRRASRRAVVFRNVDVLSKELLLAGGQVGLCIVRNGREPPVLLQIHPVDNASVLELREARDEVVLSTFNVDLQHDPIVWPHVFGDQLHNIDHGYGHLHLTALDGIGGIRHEARAPVVVGRIGINEEACSALTREGRMVGQGMDLAREILLQRVQLLGELRVRLEEEGLPLSGRAVLEGAIIILKELREGVAIRSSQVDENALGLGPRSLLPLCIVGHALALRLRLEERHGRRRLC